MSDKLLRRPEVEELCGLSRSALYERMNPKSPRYDPSFPVPVRIGLRAVRWPERAVLAWILTRDPAQGNR